MIVRRAGFLTTVQDLGRTGYRASGVSVGGALDPHALRVANLLVANEENAAGLEMTLGSVRLVFDSDRSIAWAGGPFEVRVRLGQLLSGRATLVRAGQEVVATAPSNGARAWLAVSGGIDVDPVLGSRSTDLRSHFGGWDGRALRDGDVMKLGQLSGRASRAMERLPGSGIAGWSAPNDWSNTRSSHGILRFVRGAESAQFPSGALIGTTFTATAESDRMGVRLDGLELTRTTNDDLISEAVAPGTIQVPPSGQPILLLGDCQTIGGYPKIAHVITVDLAAAAQLQVGDAVRFAEVTLQEAQSLLLQRERDLQWFRAALKLRVP